MRRSELPRGIREMKFVSVERRFGGGGGAGISDRAFRRWPERSGEEGPTGLTDRRRGNAAYNRAVPVAMPLESDRVGGVVAGPLPPRLDGLVNRL